MIKIIEMFLFIFITKKELTIFLRTFFPSLYPEETTIVYIVVDPIVNPYKYEFKEEINNKPYFYISLSCLDNFIVYYEFPYHLK